MARTTKAVPAGNDRYRTLVEGSSDPILVIRDQLLLFGNPAAVRLFGATAPRDLIGTRILDRVHPDFRREVTARMKALAAGAASVPRIEVTLLRLDGTAIDVEIESANIVFDGTSAIQVAVRDISARKRAELALAVSEARLRTIFERMTEGFSIQEVICDAEGKPCDLRFIDANPAFERQTGLKNADTLGHTLLELFPTSERYWIERYGRVALSGEPTQFEATFGPLGIVYQANAFQTEPGRFGTLFTDISERKKAEEALRHRTEELATLLEVSQSLSVTIDLQVILQTATDRIAELTAMKTAAVYILTGDVLRLWATTPPLPPQFPEALRLAQLADHPHVREAITTRKAVFLPDAASAALTEAERAVTVLRGLRSILYLPLVAGTNVLGVLIVSSVDDVCSISVADMDLCQTLANVTAMATANGQLYDASQANVVELEQVIAERQRAEEALRESVQRYRGLFDQANEGLLIMTTDGQVAEVNRAFAAMHGYSVDELSGIDIRTLDALHERALEDRAGIIRGILDGEVARFEVDHLHKDGHVFPLSVTTSLINLGGQPFFLAFHQDITERRHAEAAKATLEAQLQQAQKMESVGLLAGGVAHDFNNMLGVILGTAELAIAQVDAAQPLHEDLQEIRKAAIRSADLTRQLLAFARQQTIAPVVLDLNETVPGMLSMLQRLIGEDISLHWQPTAALWPVMMDPSQMDQILTNLCVNARHAIADVGTVTIATANLVVDTTFCDSHAEAVPGEYVQLSVRDTGSGMDAKTQARIFEPFFSTKGVGVGTGLGLATVYGAVKQNQGFVTVSSTPGEGATFEIYLPRHQGTPVPARQGGADVADLRGGETILLVEDEPALIRFVTKAFEALGYVVLAASSAADALRLATAHPGEIHLLVSDVVMPEMNGRDLAQALLQLRPTLKPLFMSGFTADVIATRGLLAPGVAFIEKPFTPVALAAKVRAVLDGQ